jgi:serine/threonine protein kinase
VSTITYKEYARKLIPRGRTFKKNIQVLKDFERELGHLKKLSHSHIVELVGSYTDPKFVAIIMSPVAEYNQGLSRVGPSTPRWSFIPSDLLWMPSYSCVLST